MPKYTYRIETYHLDKWVKILEAPRNFCEGFLYARRDMYPGPAYRLLRSDERVVDTVEAHENVSLGQIAGFPTAYQYDRAAQEALKKAALIRNHEARQDALRVARQKWAQESPFNLEP